MLKQLYLFLCLALLGNLSSAQVSLILQDSLTYPSNCSDIWGYTDSLGNEFAIVTRVNGVSIVDVTDPTDVRELHWLSSPYTSTWRDAKVWEQYCYITNENNGGLLIIDLTNVLDTTMTLPTYSTSLGGRITSAHNIYIDEQGYGYVVGADYLMGGAIVIDCDSIPTNPPVVGVYNENYIHDCYVRGDTMWAAEINAGQFAVVDMSDKSSPTVLATQTTSDNFCHNIWISDDGAYCFTTDERSSSFIDAYDVSDLTDIKRIDMIQSNPGSGVIPHNTFYLDGWLVTSYYRDGITVHDAHIPSILVETGNFDTSPLLSGTGFNGSWGVYPYFESGTIIASDIERGLYVLAPNYVRACYLQGKVTDTLTTLPIDSVLVEIIALGETEYSNVLGDYAMGIADTGNFNVRFSKVGYDPKVISGVAMSRGVITTLDVELFPQVPFEFRGTVCDSATGIGINGAKVLVKSASDEYYTTTNSSGTFIIDTLFKGTYDIYAGKWGHWTKASFGNFLSPFDTIWSDSLCLPNGYYDDATFDLGWTPTNSASTGLWTRAEPIGTLFGSDTSNPDFDVSGDFLDKAFISGNGGGGAGTDDIDNGSVTLTSPWMDLSTYHEPIVYYDRWLFIDGGSGAPNDSLQVWIDNGSTRVLVEGLADGSTTESTWVAHSFLISDYLSPTASTRIEFVGMDNAPGHLVEVGMDHFYVRDSLPPVPDAAFETDASMGCEPLEVNFTDLSTNSPTSWNWTFPGGSPSTSSMANPTVSFLAGTHIVKLVVGNAFGSDSHTMVITVYPKPVVSVLSTPSSGSDGKAIASTSGGTAPYSYTWSTGSTADSITGLASGVYSVIVVDANSCQDTLEFYVPDINTGIQERANQQFALFPNPGQSWLNLKVGLGLQPSLVRLYDLSGILQSAYNLNPQLSEHYLEIDLSQGSYLFELFDSKGQSLGVMPLMIID